MAKGFGICWATLGLVLSLAVSVPSQSLAGSPDAVRVSQEMSHALLKAIPWDKLLDSQAGEFGKTFSDGMGRPEWTGYMLTAAREEFQAKNSMIEQSFASYLASQFSDEELISIEPMFLGEAGDYMSSIVANTATKKSVSPPSPAVMKTMQKLEKSGAARRFSEKFANLNYQKYFESEFIQLIVPGMFRRFGEKAEAAEIARRGMSLQPEN